MSRLGDDVALAFRECVRLDRRVADLTHRLAMVLGAEASRMNRAVRFPGPGDHMTICRRGQVWSRKHPEPKP
jgi:hypothetical protein